MLETTHTYDTIDRTITYSKEGTKIEYTGKISYIEHNQKGPTIK
jgi:hypothetical protein